MKLFNSKSFVANVLLGVLLIESLPLSTVAATTNPNVLVYQGRLLSASGTPISTTQSVRFSMWKSADWTSGDGGNGTGTGGVSTSAPNFAGWLETQSVTPVATGVFSVTLGSISTLPTFYPSQHLYLQVEIKPSGSGNLSYELIDPQGTTADTIDREVIGSVPYAKMSDNGGGSVSTGTIISMSDPRYLQKQGGTMTGSLTVQQNVHVGGATSFSGTVSIEMGATIGGKLTLQTGALSINGINYHFPSSLGASGSVMTTDSVGNLSWVTPYRNTFSTGNVFTLGNSWFVKKSGDSMTGALAILNGKGLTASGAIRTDNNVFASGSITVDGSALIKTNTTIKGSLTVQTGAVSVNGLSYLFPSTFGMSGAVLTLDNVGKLSWIKAVNTGSVTTIGDPRYVQIRGDTMTGDLLLAMIGGTGGNLRASGSILAQTALRSSGTLTIESDALIRGNMALGADFTPNSQLSVFSNFNSADIQLTTVTSGVSSNDGLFIGHVTTGGGRGEINQRESLPLVFKTNNIERVRIASGGNIGIGTVSPAALFTVAGAMSGQTLVIKPTLASQSGAITIMPYGAVAGNTAQIRYRELTANGSNYTGFKAPDSLFSNRVYVLPSATGSLGSFLSIGANNQLSWTTNYTGTLSGSKLTLNGINVAPTGVPFTLCLTGTGQVVKNNATTCTVSSQRFKHDIVPITVGLQELLLLNPVQYRSNGDNTLNEGFIAEQVANVDPRLVFYEQDGTTIRGVKYENLTAILTKAVQELEQRVKELEGK